MCGLSCTTIHLTSAQKTEEQWRTPWEYEPTLQHLRTCNWLLRELHRTCNMQENQQQDFAFISADQKRRKQPAADRKKGKKDSCLTFKSFLCSENQSCGTCRLVFAMFGVYLLCGIVISVSFSAFFHVLTHEILRLICSVNFLSKSGIVGEIISGF